MAVEAAIDARRVSTRGESREEFLRSADFFEVATFPQIGFTGL